MQWNPHLTVATIVEKNGLFLCVQEKISGKIVLNQPAGHVEAFENLIDAAKRETWEETGWHVEITHFIGVYVYTSPSNGITYYRHCFAGEAIARDTNFQLEPGIIDAVWMTLDEIKQCQNMHRSPLVIKCAEDYMRNQKFPLCAIYEHSLSQSNWNHGEAAREETP